MLGMAEGKNFPLSMGGRIFLPPYKQSRAVTARVRIIYLPSIREQIHLLT